MEIVDFLMQSCWRRSGALAAVAEHCDKLLNLEIKNAWLTVEGLKPMPNLTNLKLEHIRLDDEDLKGINDCFPSLQVLHLIDVGGLKEPRIQLKILHWTVSNAPLSLTISTPELTKLNLECIKPKNFIFRAPSLSHLTLKV
ncbi:F-box/LRR-repeat protein [Acorus gramineus]|uniref:F-box/LRR-repeat protein n=1 Tax=Acorus gramineus TaxID=55184 RepID=A0AAV9AP27_ACOGR|nr:F-box/LRR-repeat protein [Acorus gramineus]